MAVVWTVVFAQGAGVGEMDLPYGITTDGSYIYVIDANGVGANNRIVRLDMDGTWVDATDGANDFPTDHEGGWVVGEYL